MKMLTTIVVEAPAPSELMTGRMFSNVPTDVERDGLICVAVPLPLLLSVIVRLVISPATSEVCEGVYVRSVVPDKLTDAPSFSAFRTRLPPALVVHVIATVKA